MESWISVKYKLPEKKGNYLVTVVVHSKDSSDYVFVTIDHYNGDGKWTDHNKKHEKIVAWMSLPNPYK